MAGRRTRDGSLLIIAALWLVGFIAIVAFQPSGPPVTVVHWANGHMTRPGLLPQMAERFNAANHRTANGQRIAVRVFNDGSAEQVSDLVSRVVRGTPLDAKLPDPVVVTPSADHWLVDVNDAAGKQVVDLTTTKSIAYTWIGIVTYREMAECLGWPNRDIGYADIIALRDDPSGWAAYPCAKAEWGQRPLLGFTDPATSSTGRSALFTLYSIAANKAPDQLTVADVSAAAAIQYVKDFQRVVDHYLPGTIPLNTKIHLGPHYGHFFLMPEDDLVHLYMGTERAVVNGVEVQAPPITRPMVMLYPKEGSTAHNHSGTLVQAPWVTPERAEAAQLWLDFLHEDEEQAAFMASGFRPSTRLPLADPISGRFGMDPTRPTATVNPDRIDRAAAKAILDSWDDVKRPGVVTFVADVSGSMAGPKLEQTKLGLFKALDGMAKTNSVGFITFADGIKARVNVGPVRTNRFAVANAAQGIRAAGNTALYDAIKAGVEMVDSAPGDEDAIRGVVVLTDGLANSGNLQLPDLVQMSSPSERPIVRLDGPAASRRATDARGAPVRPEDVIGTALAQPTQHRVLIFFVGIGNDADMQIGRILAEATGAAFTGTTEKDLAAVLEAFGRYF